MNSAVPSPRSAPWHRVYAWGVCLLTGLVLAGHALAANTDVPVDRIVAVVNSEIITAVELQERVRQAVHQLQKQGTPLPSREVLEKQLLDQLIMEKAQLQLARESGIQVDDATLARAIDRIAENNKLAMPAFREALKRDGISWETFRDAIRREIMLTRLREREINSKIVVTDAEVDNFIKNNPSATQSEEYHVAHILLRVPEGANERQFKELVARAQEIEQRLHSGDDFAKLAATYSNTPDALNGGDLGWRGADRLPPLYLDAVTKLQPGEVSQILRSAAGLHIVKLLEKRGADTQAAEKVTQTHVRHILIKTSEIVNDEEARRRLLALRERIVNGGDFATLAKANSADISAAKGGDIGWVYPGDTVPEFERVMNALKPGEVSMPVQTPFGWHLIQVLERRQQDVSAERKRAQVRTALSERKAEEAYQDWLAQLRDRTYVENRLEQP